MNPVVPRNILFLTMMIIVCFFACSMATVYPATSMKYEIGDDVSCGAGLDQVCCPVGKGETANAAIGSTNKATNKPGRPGCLCRCAVPPIDEEGANIDIEGDPVEAYCQKDQGGWVPPTTEGTPAKKAAKKYKKL